MALKDVKQYYLAMQKQYYEMRDDLTDYEIAVRDGNITEDQLNDVKEEIEKIQENYKRLSYIMFLFELPNNIKNKEKYLNSKNAKNIKQYLNKDDQSALELENKSSLDKIRTQLNIILNLKK